MADGDAGQGLTFSKMTSYPMDKKMFWASINETGPACEMSPTTIVNIIMQEAEDDG